MKWASCLMAGAATLTLAGVVLGAPIYAASFVTESLYRVDLEPGPPGVVEIGPFGANFTEGGLSFRTSDEVLFGAFTGALDSLYTINTESGLATPVGPFGPDGLDVSGIAFTPPGMFEEELLFGVDSYDNKLITIDTVTGVGVPFGDGHMGIEIGPVAGMTFDLDGTLYLVDNLTKSLYAFYGIVAGDDTATLIGDLGLNKPTGLTFALVNGEATLFVADEADTPGEASELYRVTFIARGDSVTVEHIELDPPLPDGVGGLAGIIPEPTTLAFLGLGAVAVAARRRYNRS